MKKIPQRSRFGFETETSIAFCTKKNHGSSAAAPLSGRGDIARLVEAGGTQPDLIQVEVTFGTQQVKKANLLLYDTGQTSSKKAARK